MTPLAELRKGWCPGALRPMRSGDGLLLRVRPRAGALSIDGLIAAVKTAARCGSGEIDLTSRANLQIRGVTDESYAEALAMLDAEHLIDADAAAESIRNIVVDPLSGIAPDRQNVRTLAMRLDDALRDDRRLWRLPAKFGFSLSGSKSAGVGGRISDIMLSAGDDGAALIGLDGDARTAARVEQARAVGAMTSLALAFLDLREGDPELARMKGAVHKHGSSAIFRRAGLNDLVPISSDASEAIPAGILENGSDVFAAAVGLPFGRIGAEALQALCEKAASLEMTRAHVSPSRVLIFPLASRDAATTFLAEADRLGLITAPDDVRLRIDVCPGAPACPNATTATRADAERLVRALNGAFAGVSVHVSGCDKGCARRASASLTLVARNARYDFILNGGPTDTVVAAGVLPATIAETAAHLIENRTR